MTNSPEALPGKRSYALGRRLEQMDRSRAAILRTAQALLAAEGYPRLTMAMLATRSGVTRQTVHNLFGSRRGVLEALFDRIALDGGLEQMRTAMSMAPGKDQATRFAATFCGFWRRNRLLLRRVHGIGAIDPEFGEVLAARNRRRLGAATRIAGHEAAVLAAVTSFEFFDQLAEATGSETEAEALVLEMARRL